MSKGPADGVNGKVDIENDNQKKDKTNRYFRVTLKGKYSTGEHGTASMTSTLTLKIPEGLLE